MTVFAPMKHKYLESTKRNLEKYRTILSIYDLFLISNIFRYMISFSDEGLTLETSAFLAFLPFTVANLRFQPSC